ncbi:MAG: hypothetical protein R3E32_21240 [Chitinophagales bacterium]
MVFYYGGALCLWVLPMLFYVLQTLAISVVKTTSTATAATAIEAKM